MSVLSRRSGLSIRSGRVGLTQKLVEQAKTANADPIAEHPNEDAGDETGNQLNQNGEPVDPNMNVQTCNECKANLGEDELTINQRLIDQALQENAAQVDLTKYPLCVKCHFE